MIKVSHHCSAILTKNLVTKNEDPGAFTIPCTIRVGNFSKTLCVLGASTNLISLAIFQEVGIDTLSPMMMWLFMVDRSMKRLIGILHDVLVKVDKFILRADFVILDCKVDIDVLIILGRPFLATKRALVDVDRGDLRFRMTEDEVMFNI